MANEKIVRYLPAVLFLIGLLILTYFLFFGPESQYQHDMLRTAAEIEQFQRNVAKQHKELEAKLASLEGGIDKLELSLDRISGDSAAGLRSIRQTMKEIEDENAKIGSMSDPDLARRVRELVEEYRGKPGIQPK